MNDRMTLITACQNSQDLTQVSNCILMDYERGEVQKVEYDHLNKVIASYYKLFEFYSENESDDA